MNSQGEEKEKALWMQAVKLLGSLAVLSLLVATSLAGPITLGCTCESAGRQDSCMSHCCGKCDASSLNQGCSCQGLTDPLTSICLYDPAYSLFGKSSSRNYSRESMPTVLAYAAEAGISSPARSPANPNDIGPPDLDVVGCLPSSAKQVFSALASHGPLTQKELISKTELPPRTVRYALSRLKGEDMLTERFCFRDARQSLYALIGSDRM